MAFISTVPVQEAAGDVRAMYERSQAGTGYVPSYARIFSHRPQVMRLWSELIRAISGGLDVRRYELVTLAAARALRSSYCALAHGAVLRQRFYEPAQLAAIVDDAATSDLAPGDAAVMAFAEQIVRDASSVTEHDIQVLREHGLGDAEIFDVAAAAAARCFFSKLLDALGAEPDSAYDRLEDVLKERLTVGRPVSREPPAVLP